MEILWNLQCCRFCWSFDNQWEDSCGSYKTLADSSYMYERFDELDSNMFGQGDVMSTRICDRKLSSKSNPQQPFTRLWWWLPLRLLKRQSPLPTTVLLRTTLTWMIKLPAITCYPRVQTIYCINQALWRGVDRRLICLPSSPCFCPSSFFPFHYELSNHDELQVNSFCLNTAHVSPGWK